MPRGYRGHVEAGRYWIKLALLTSSLISIVNGASLTPQSSQHQQLQHSQLPLHPQIDASVGTASTSVVQVLAADPDFSLFIRLLQRARLIPTLNRLVNATIFAPTNDALRRREGTADDLLDYIKIDHDDVETLDDQDNLQYRLRERLFYHMLNYTLDNETLSNCDRRRETTLLYPTTHEQHGRPGQVPYPDPVETLLGGEGQQVRISGSGNTTPDGQAGIRIGFDEQSVGGANVLLDKGGIAHNGLVYGVSEVLNSPKSLAHQLRARENPSEGPSLTRFASLLSPDQRDELTATPHLTFFAPEDKAFDALEPLEWRYLISGFAADDILEIFSNHQSQSLGENATQIGYSDRLASKGTVPLLSGNSVSVSLRDGTMTVNGSSVVTSDILASNGVMHIVDKLLLPRGSLALTAEKYLLALNATKFVTMFRAAGISDLLRSSKHNPDNNAQYTILAARDDVLDRLSTLPWQSLPPQGSPELKDTLSYHVIEGKWTKDHLKDGQLVKSMLRTPDLGGSQQRLAVSLTSSEAGHTDVAKLQLSFGSANVVAEPIDVGHSIIYLISHILQPPSNVITTSLDRGLSTFVAGMYAAGLDSTFLHRSPATTFLTPTNAAFDYMGMALTYFLSAPAKADLRKLLNYHALDGILYSKDLPYDSTHRRTHEGSDIYLERHTNKSGPTHVRGREIDGVAVNGDIRDARIIEADLLTSTGVLLVIDQVEIPPSIRLTSQKLMLGAKANTFLDLLRQANLSWIAEGRLHPDDTQANFSSGGTSKRRRRKRDKKAKRGVSHASYTILCPTDKAFARLNLSQYLDNPAELLALVQLHIIPVPHDVSTKRKSPLSFPEDGSPLALADEASFATLLSDSEGGSSQYGDVSFRRSGEADWLVGIKNARGTSGRRDAARILSHGRNTPIFKSRDGGPSSAEATAQAVMSSGGGVLLIDAVLEPYYPNWFHRWGYIVLSVALSVVAVTVLSTLLYTLYAYRKRQRAEYQAVPQAENEED